MVMRKQYYFRPSDRGYKAWDVDRLVALTKGFPRIQVALSDIRELDEAFPSDEKGVVTWRNVVGHMALIEAPFAGSLIETVSSVWCLLNKTPFLLPWVGFSASTVIASKLLQEENAAFPMRVTFLPIMTLVKLLQE